MTGERADQDYDIKSVAEILHRHVDTERRYANYWKFSLDRKIEEQHIAVYLLDYLEAYEGWTGTKLASSERDPPDCFGVTSDGGLFGIEVTELVHRKTVERHQLRRNAERRGLPPSRKAATCSEVAIWTTAALRETLVAKIQEKDKPAIWSAPLGVDGTGDLN